MPIKITFKNMQPSAAAEERIRAAADKLRSFYAKMTDCQVVIEAPHRHHRKGKQYQIHIHLIVPEKELVIKHAPRRIVDRPLRAQKDPSELRLAETRKPSKYAAHDELYVAIRDAFDAARRKLQDYARRRRGSVKRRVEAPHGSVAKLFPELDYGFIETVDGREIYFHRNSVTGGGFDALQIGTEVHFAEEEGEKGPQASTITPVRHHGQGLRRTG